MAETSCTAREIAHALEAWADPAFAESYDNVGLQVGSPDQVVSRVLIALDLTPAALDEAVQKGASMIVTHHPLLFRAVSHVLENEFIGQLILRLARENITLYSIHTNLDAAYGGVSMALAEVLGLQNGRFLHPNADASSGMGAIGELSQPQSLKTFMDQIHETLGTPAVRYTGSLHSDVQTVAVCGGAGGGLIQTALHANADVYVTADLSYHRFFEVLGPDGQCQMALIDAGHYETEKHTEPLLCRWLNKRFPGVIFEPVSCPTNPVRYSIL